MNPMPQTLPLRRSTRRQAARGAAGGEEVVDDVGALAGFDGVGVHFYGVGAVFETIFFGDFFEGELAEFAGEDEGKVELESHGGAEDESTAFDADDALCSFGFGVLGKDVDDFVHGLGALEHGVDVFEHDARLWKVGDIADEGFGQQIWHAQGFIPASGLVFDFGARFPALGAGEHEGFDVHISVDADLAGEAEVAEFAVFFEAGLFGIAHGGLG